VEGLGAVTVPQVQAALYEAHGQHVGESEVNRYLRESRIRVVDGKATIIKPSNGSTND
jgi:hypothetical protein